MIIRVAILSDNKRIVNEISKSLIAFSVKNDFDKKAIELDIAIYKNQIDEFVNNYKNIDIAFITYESLEIDTALADKLFVLNPMCFPVLVGSPKQKICSFLALRPAGQVSEEIESPIIAKLCLSFVKVIASSNHVLQIHTRKGDYSISVQSIVFCQSDQKYVTIVTDSGKNYRRIGTLNQLQINLSDGFIRVHQSFLVNLKKIKSVDKVTWEIETNEGYHIPVSRPYRQKVQDYFKNSF